ncbi:hypothetical protein ABT112_27375 [Streptomyces sp. NPDC002055]|uniref:hypothetical protein n=1 Tax=Streptomyces sp. NPDC002055 TaxID=3154534 RepID=UPI00331A49D9
MNDPDTDRRTDTTDTGAAAPPGDYRLLLPNGWFRITLDPERRKAAVDALVDRQFQGMDDAPHIKRMVRSELLGRAKEAYRNGGIELYLSLQTAGPLTIPASLLLTLVTPDRPGGIELEALAQHLFDSGPLDQDVSIEELQAGRAIRVRTRKVPEQNDPGGNTAPVTTVDYHVGVPGSDSFLLLAFSTPLDPLADAMVELFDAVAHSLIWIG